MALRTHRFRLDAQSMTPTPSGGIRVERARLGRVGIQRYRTVDGEIVEYRSPEQVFAPESLATYQDAALTISRHPDDDVDAGNWRHLAHGYVAGPAVRAGDWVEAPVVISSAEAVKAVRNGDLIELSCGYYADLVHRSGEYQGQDFTDEQTNIRINHLTLLPPGRARAGRDARLVLDELEPERVRRLDANGDEVVDEDIEGERQQMAKHRFTRDAVSFEVEGDAAAGQALGMLEADVSKARKDAADEKKRADEATTKAQELEGKLAVASDPKRLDEAVSARVKLLDQAVKIGAKRDELEGLSERDVMLKALGGAIKADEKTTDAFIHGAFMYAAAKATDKKSGGKRDHLDDAAASIFDAVTNHDGAGDERRDDVTKLLDELDEREDAHKAKMTGRRSAEAEE